MALKMQQKLTIQLSEINPHLICTLCDGYFVEATTIIECLHSFCKSCIVNHLNANKFCPKCKTPVHWMRPFLNIRSDKTLQSIVNKLIPDLSKNEINRRMEFSLEKGIPFETGCNDNEEKLTEKEKVDQYVNLSIDIDKRPFQVTPDKKWKRKEALLGKRYFRCVEAVPIATINKMLRLKFEQNDLIEVLTFCRGEVLHESHSLKDVARIFDWKSDRQLSLTYMVFVRADSKVDADSPGENEIQPKLVPVDEISKAKQEVVPVSNSPTVGQGGFREMPHMETTPNEKEPTTAPIDVAPKYNPHTGKNLPFYTVLNYSLPNDQKMEAVEAKRDESLDNKIIGTRIANSPEKSKNIDFIANRLQMKQKMQSADVLMTEPANKHVQPKITEGVRKLNSLSNVEAHNLALECVRNKMHLIKSTGSFMDARAAKDIAPHPTRFRAQAIRRNPSQQFRPVKSKVQIRPKFMPIRYSTEVSAQRAKSSEDLQLLSTTRQLATLRQQQKILNEIAAAVSAKGSVTKSNERKYARALTSTMKVQPAVDIGVNQPGFIRHQDPSIPHHVKISRGFTPRELTQNVVNIRPTFQYVQNPTPSPNQSPRNHFEPTCSLKQNLYRNTLEKAKACVRDIKIRPKIVPAQSRAPVAPYQIPIKSWKLNSVNQSRQRPVPAMPVSKVFHTVNSPVVNVAPPKPRIEEPLSRPYYETTSSPMPPPVTQSTQDQPLCLVIKK